jgi:hypothetical protein
MTKEKFLQHHSIAKSTFGYWLKKYRDEKSTSYDNTNFIPVKISDSVKTNNSSVEIELFYPNGVRLVCSSDMDISKLKPLIVL